MNQWITEQKDFSHKCRLLRNEYLNGWGCYIYNIHCQPFEDSYFPIWQFFCSSYCKVQDIDYTLFPIKNDVNLLLQKKEHFSEQVYNKIYDFICKLKNEGEEIVCIIGDSGLKNVNEINGFNDFHFKYLKNKLITNNILTKREIINVNEFYDFIEDSYDELALGTTIIFLELISENSRLKECSYDVSLLGSFLRKIVYISLAKEYDRNEMLEIIKKKEDEIKEKEAKLIQLHSLVEDWNTLFIKIRYSYQYNYYPTTCDFDATEYEWAVRRLIWNFKNDPDKKIREYDHKVAMNKVINELIHKLRKTFGSNVSKLTLVCIPASTKVKNEARFKEFSETICKKMNMINAYPFINISQDRIAKHLGGTGEAELTFDRFFFNGKNIILFDDVVTKGTSMLKFYSKMKNLGANVICALSIGKTKHERSAEPLSWLSDE